MPNDDYIKRTRIAVASSRGIDVDLHIGHTKKFLIYGHGDDGRARMIGTRAAPEPGGGESRWKELAEILDDCFALLTSGGGQKPVNTLEDHGISVFIIDGNVMGTVDTVFRLRKKKIT